MDNDASDDIGEYDLLDKYDDNEVNDRIVWYIDDGNGVYGDGDQIILQVQY